MMNLANSIRAAYLTSYPDYLEHLATIFQVFEKLGIKHEVSTDVLKEVGQRPADDLKVDNFLQQTRRCYRELTGEELSPGENQRNGTKPPLQSID